MTDLTTAAAELDAALNKLENCVEAMFDQQSRARLAAAESEALRRDRAQLAIDLDNSRARERELEALADEASRALGDAIAEVRAAMAAQSN